jgi:SAM-dependent methyltransferase
VQEQELVLDVGCGYAPEHRPCKEAHIKLDLIRGKANIIADAHHLPFKSEIFSKVVMYEVIEHVHHPKQVLTEIHRVLKRDGILELTTPNIMSIGNYFWWIINPNKLQISEHIYGWRLPELKNLLQLTGFKIIKFYFVDLPRFWRPGRFARIFVLPRLTKHHLFYSSIKNK